MAHIHYGAAGQANGKAVVVLLPVGGVDAVRCPPCPSSPALPCALQWSAECDLRTLPCGHAVVCSPLNAFFLISCA